MSGRAPRWIKEIQKAPTIVLTGSFSANYAYVTIGETKYSTEAEIKVPYGSIVSIYLDAVKTFARTNCVVTLNGETVKSGYGTYEYEAKLDSTLTFAQYQAHSSSGDASIYYKCAITTS